MLDRNNNHMDILNTINQDTAKGRKLYYDIQYAVSPYVMLKHIIIPSLNLKGITVISTDYNGDLQITQFTVNFDKPVFKNDFSHLVSLGGWFIVEGDKTGVTFKLQPKYGYREADLKLLDDEKFYFITDSISIETATDLMVSDLKELDSIAIGKRAKRFTVYRDPSELIKAYKDHPRAVNAVVYTLSCSRMRNDPKSPHWLYDWSAPEKFFTYEPVLDTYASKIISFKSFKEAYGPAKKESI